MRSSGERKAFDDEDDEESRNSEERAPVDGSDHASPTASRPYPIWLKIEPSKRRFAPPPTGLSRATWARLSRQIAAYLRARLNNNVTLRQAVRHASAEMLLAGHTRDDVAAALRRAVLEHPELGTLDRTNVVTRRLASEDILERMLEWARDIGAQNGDPTGPHDPSS